MLRRGSPLVGSVSALPWLLLFAPSCSFDTEAPAPYVAPPRAAGACGTTETLLPKLLVAVKEDELAPLRTVVERRLIPSESNPRPDPSLRTLLGAVVKLISGLGLDLTVKTASVATQSPAIKELTPLIVAALQFTAGQNGGTPHYQATDAAALFIRQCNADHLLTAAESLLRLRSPPGSGPAVGRPWLAVVGDELRGLVEDPALVPFLDTFERDAKRGRPAIVALLVQIMTFVADDNFDISRVRTLLESVVYPLVNEALRMKLERLLALLDEATGREAGIFLPLQRAVKCGMDHPPERDELLGFAFDLITDESIGLDRLLMSVEGLASDRDAEKNLVQIAEVISVLRKDVAARDDILALVALVLSRPDVELLLPMGIELLQQGVVGELFDAVTTLLGDCESDAG